MKTTAITFGEVSERNGDKVCAVYLAGRYIGSLRELRGPASVGDWHAVTQRKGRMVGRYYGSKLGAVGWLRRQAT